MSKGIWNESITRGDSVIRTIKWETGNPLAAVDLTGASAKLQARDGTGNVVLELSSLADPPSITMGGDAGTMTLHFTSAKTSIEPGDYPHDLEVTLTDGSVRTLLGGVISILSEVTT